MAVVVCGNCIEFGNATMCSTTPGFSIGSATFTACGFLDNPFGGTSTAYNMGNPCVGCSFFTIDKFPFASETTCNFVGNLSLARRKGSGHGSAVSGYSSAGVPGIPTAGITIDKFPFATDTNASDVGDLNCGRYDTFGFSSKIQGFGFTVGGFKFPPPEALNNKEKFPFASDTNATNIGDGNKDKHSGSSTQSPTEGYSGGGSEAPPAIGNRNNIERFSFTSDGNSVDTFGELTRCINGGKGISSDDFGYTVGGYTPGSGTTNIIDKFPFAAGGFGGASDVGDLSTPMNQAATHSSRTCGYATTPNALDRFPFASDTNATCIGDINLSSDTMQTQI